MKILLTIALLIIANYSFADGLYTGAWSYHYYKDEVQAAGTRVNSNQNLIAYEHKTYLIGYFKNSLYHDTVLAGKYFSLYTGHDIEIGVYAGVNYGYRWCGNNRSDRDSPVVCPYAMPTIRYTKYSLQPAVLVFSNGAAISFRWDIK